MRKLSFIHSDFSQLIQLMPQLVKGLHKASGIWKRNGHWNEQSIIKEELQAASELEDEGLINRIEDFAITRKKHLWLTRDNLPFQERTASVLQYQLTPNQEESVLVLYLEKPSTFEKDLLFLYFNMDYNYFELRKKAAINSQEKSIIASVIWNCVEAFRQKAVSDHDLFHEIISHKKETDSEAYQLREQLENERNTRGQSLKEYAELVAERQGEILKIPIGFTNRALDKIKEQAHSFKQLEHSLKKSIRIAYNLSPEQPGQLLLDDFDITLNKLSQKAVNKVTKEVKGRLESTHNLLDKYEQAAEKARMANERIIGKVIGAFCEPPISNAAITDALKNHRERILQLMDKFPGKWPIIRSNFKSVTNLLDQSRFQSEKKVG